jgi:hypothetical protein
MKITSWIPSKTDAVHNANFILYMCTSPDIMISDFEKSNDPCFPIILVFIPVRKKEVEPLLIVMFQVLNAP